MEHFSVGSRQKIYLILVSLSLILLFYSIWEIKPVIVETDDPIGLVSHLTPAYWIGLTLLLVVSIFAFLDQEVKSDFTYVAVLLALGLFLVGIVVFAYANTRDPDVYYPNSEVYRLVDEGTFDIEALPIAAHYSWPTLHIMNVAVRTVSGMNGDFIQGFVKYMPLFWILMFVLTTYGIGKRLGLAPRWCFLLSFLPLASWWELNHYHNHSWAVLLYLLLFLLLLRTKGTVGESVATILLFSALLLTHGTTALIFILAFLMLSMYRRDTRFVALFPVLFCAWYVYAASRCVGEGLSQALSDPFRQIVNTAQAERYQLPSVVARDFARYSQLVYLATYLTLVMASAILLLRGKIPREYRKLVIACFVWTVGVAPLIFSGLLAPELHRFYLLSLVPAAVIIVLSFSTFSRTLTAALMIGVLSLTVGLRLPAEYAVEAAWIQVPTTELKGSEFFVRKVEPSPALNPLYFSANVSVAALLLGVDPRVEYSWELRVSTLPPWPEIEYGEIDKWVEYIMISKQGVASELFAFGQRAYTAWPQSEGGRRADLLYDNGEFQLYYNRLAEETRDTAYFRDRDR